MSSTIDNNNSSETSTPDYLGNYLKMVDQLEHNPKFSKKQVEDFKRACHNLMPKYPTIFCKMLSGNKALIEEAKQDFRSMLLAAGRR